MFAFDCVPSTVYYPDVSPVMDNKSLSTGHISVSCEAARDRLTRSPACVPFRGVTSGSVPGTNGWGSACVRATGLADASFKRRINCGMAGSSSPLRDLTSADHQMDGPVSRAQHGSAETLCANRSLAGLWGQAVPCTCTDRLCGRGAIAVGVRGLRRKSGPLESLGPWPISDDEGDSRGYGQGDVQDRLPEQWAIVEPKRREPSPIGDSGAQEAAAEPKRG